MSKDLNLYKLSQPEKLENVLAADREDCLSCRITGNPLPSIVLPCSPIPVPLLLFPFPCRHHKLTHSAFPTGASAFLALGAYTYYSGTTQLQSRRAEILKSGSRFGMKARGTGVVGLSALLVGMGLYRFVN